MTETDQLRDDIRRIDDENTKYRHEARGEMQRLYIELVELKGAMAPLVGMQVEVGALRNEMRSLQQTRTEQRAVGNVVALIWKGAAAVGLVAAGGFFDRWFRGH
jgi:hypothetical protein